MENKKESFVRIELTETQKQQIRETTGRDLDALEFQVEPLEDRVAPLRIRGIRI